MLNDGDDVTRRGFLKLLGASIALAGLDGCTRIPAEKILPYVHQPPELTPGIPVHYATSMVLDGYATGLVVEAHEGRPTKVEGNPEHPASLGAAGVLEQASLLQLYDPHRGTSVRQRRTLSSWQAFANAFAPSQLGKRVGPSGEGLALLLEPTSSPLIADLIARLQTIYPQLGVYYYAPLARNDVLVRQYDIAAADVILSVDSDFLSSGPFNQRYARAFADRRRDPRTGMNRLYVLEPGMTITGAAADHRFGLRPTEIEAVLEQLASPTAATRSADAHAPWLDVLRDDLQANTGRSLIIGSDRLSPRAQLLVDVLNERLGNEGKTVWHTASPLLGAGDERATLSALVDAMRASSVDTLVCIGGNPSYATSGALRFSALLRRIPNSAYVGLYENETARDTQWFVPAAHYLETWGDARAYDGTLSTVQPLVQPLHGGRSPIEILAALGGSVDAKPLDLLRDRWRSLEVAPNDDVWNAVLRQGFAVGTAAPRVSSPARRSMPSSVAATALRREMVSVRFVPDGRVYDGSFANNAWLQELPDPVTKLTWDNAALLSPVTAARLDSDNGDPIVLEGNGASLEIPILIVPGHADDTVTLPFGYGRTGTEEVARDVGVDVYRLWPGLDAFTMSAGIRRGRGPRRDFALTQTHFSMEGRDQARTTTLAAYRAGWQAPPPRRRELTIYDPVQQLTAPQQWAMTIDLGTCIGCSACVVACQAENNIPVVGRDDVRRSREMHWIRIDRYEHGAPNEPAIVTQPMLCQQCEHAPCEYVCPVGATTHSADGLNEMVYNRCVGTRFCSNNCPYKVRRFNWFDYNAELTEVERMVKNPDVTVRERGVMEKCTFCVQRIREAEIAAGNAGQPLRGGDVQTACQQSCPTNAIVFGSLTEPDSDVVRRRREPRAYAVLDDLGTLPRVQYLARIRNPNPALAGGPVSEHRR